MAPLSRKIDVLALKALLRMTPAENGNHWIILISLLDCQLSCADKEELVSSLVLDKLPMDLKFSFWIIKRQAEREEGIYEKMEEDVLDCLFGILPVPHADTKYCQKLLQLAASFVPIYREIIAQNFVDGSEIFLNYGLEECLLILDYLFDILGSDLMVPHLKEIKGDKNWKVLLEFLGTALPKDFRDFLKNTSNVNKASCGEKRIIVKELFERTKMTSLNLKRFISYMQLPN